MDLIYLKAGVEGPLHFWWNDPELVRQAWRASRVRKDTFESLRIRSPVDGPDPVSKAKGPGPIW
jgi:hypothetical protein